jgi:4-alpha-methyl-delta7-sterol-4alpha-methyl oxidase
MELISYISEECTKIKTNFFPTVLSGVITLLVYSTISQIFYLLWPYILSSFNFGENLWYFRYLGPQIWKLTVVITLQLFCLYCYKVQPAIIEKYRYVEKWPWEEDRAAWMKFLKKSLLNYVLNQLVVSPIMFYYFMKLGKPLRADMTSWPTIWEILYHVIVFDFINDFLLWATHVMLHWRKIYFIHKIHHEYKDVVSISGEYFHPIEFLINSFAIIAGPKLFGARSHMISYFMWQMTRIWDNIIQNHSGYMFPWRPLGICPFQNGNSFHYWHHDRNIGNYSFNYNFWDRIFGFDSKFQQAVKAGKIKVM